MIKKGIKIIIIGIIVCGFLVTIICTSIYKIENVSRKSKSIKYLTIFRTQFKI